MRTRILKLWFFALALISAGCTESIKFISLSEQRELFVQSYNIEAYDFLWVMDNSESMTSNRDTVRNNLRSFLETLNKRKAIDFQMAITTTDGYLNGDGYFHGGKLVSASGKDVVKSSEGDPVADFMAITGEIRSSPSAFWEQGLESAYQAVSMSGEKFMRPNVPLVMIFLTDENDYSCQGRCTGNAPERHYSTWDSFPTQRYIDFFNDLKITEGKQVLAFPLVGTNEDACEGVVRGERYLKLLEGIESGKAGSICPNSLVQSYTAIADTLSNRASRFKLAKNPSTHLGLSVYVDGKPVNHSIENGFIYEDATNSIVFTGEVPPNNSRIEVEYQISD